MTVLKVVDDPDYTPEVLLYDRERRTRQLIKLFLHLAIMATQITVFRPDFGDDTSKTLDQAILQTLLRSQQLQALDDEKRHVGLNRRAISPVSSNAAHDRALYHYHRTKLYLTMTFGQVEGTQVNLNELIQACRMMNKSVGPDGVEFPRKQLQNDLQHGAATSTSFWTISRAFLSSTPPHMRHVLSSTSWPR